MAGAFAFKLEYEDGTPADPPVLHTAVPTWAVDDTIPLGAGKTLRVTEVLKASGLDEAPVLVVEAST